MCSCAVRCVQKVLVIANYDIGSLLMVVNFFCDEGVIHRPFLHMQAKVDLLDVLLRCVLFAAPAAAERFSTCKPKAIYWMRCFAVCRNYIACDMGSLFESAGFSCDTKYMSSATKTWSFRKPDTQATSSAAAAPAAADSVPTNGSSGNGASAELN
jgi:hypothetical protein